MAQIDWTGGRKVWPEGRYRFEVRGCEEKVSKSSGASMFVVGLSALDWGGEMLCQDIIMLGGKGAGIGIQKLKALGFSGTEREIKAGELVGRRGFCNLGIEEYQEGDKPPVRQSKVGWEKGDGSMCGYWPETVVPDGVLEPEESMDDSAPF